MCLGCDLKNGEQTKILENSATNFIVYLENKSDIVKLHMTDGTYHTTKEIYHCPFCGRTLVKL